MVAKKWIPTAILVLAFGVCAQQLQDVVHFKDGRVIGGSVMEEIPGVRLAP